ncbi:MAG: ATPase, T2SS/T4P/T4SS family [Planctomycetota bacterium]
MNLETFVDLAKRRGASDVHLEPGLPVALRVDGWLTTGGEPIAGVLLTSIARGLLGDAGWQAFTTRGSADVSRTVQGARCRINVFRTMRGTALAVRLLATFQPTLARLNLLPELQELMETSHGLVIVTGPTGAGKSSTIAALIQKINETDSRHVVTIEDPIEYYFAPRKAFIRQREVGRDTPSFAQGLQDSLREDPDVLLVGEMRDPETMRLTLNAAETGRLVLTTLHSASVSDALQRLLSAFPAEHRPAIQSQLADCLRVIVAQRLRLFPDVGARAGMRDPAHHPFGAQHHPARPPVQTDLGARDRRRRWPVELRALSQLARESHELVSSRASRRATHRTLNRSSSPSARRRCRWRRRPRSHPDRASQPAPTT